MPKARLDQISKKLLKITILENSEISEADIYQINESQNKLMEKAKCFVLFVPPKYGSISQEAISASASKELNSNSIAKAILVKNLAHRIVARFFIQIKKPGSPTRIFTNEAAALEWFALIEKQNQFEN